MPKENFALRYADNMSTLSIFAFNAASTVVWAAFRAAEVTVALGVWSNIASSVDFFLGAASRAKNSSSMALTSTPAIDTLVVVAIT